MEGVQLVVQVLEASGNFLLRKFPFFDIEVEQYELVPHTGIVRHQFPDFMGYLSCALWVGVKQNFALLVKIVGTKKQSGVLFGFFIVQGNRR